MAVELQIFTRANVIIGLQNERGKGVCEIKSSSECAARGHTRRNEIREENETILS